MVGKGGYLLVWAFPSYPIRTFFPSSRQIPLPGNSHGVPVQVPLQQSLGWCRQSSPGKLWWDFRQQKICFSLKSHDSLWFYTLDVTEISNGPLIEVGFFVYALFHTPLPSSSSSIPRVETTRLRDLHETCDRSTKRCTTRTSHVRQLDVVELSLSLEHITSSSSKTTWAKHEQALKKPANDNPIIQFQFSMVHSNIKLPVHHLEFS